MCAGLPRPRPWPNSTRARAAAARFWPGPLSLVLRRRAGSGLALLASAGLDTVAVRAPAHPVAQALLEAAQRPLAAPSANRSGRVSATAAAHVVAELAGQVALVLDAGPSPIGIESTVLDLTDEIPALLRPGGVPVEELTPLVGPLAAPAGGPVRAPGQLASHYAPSLPVRLEARAARPGEALLAFGGEAPPGFRAVLWLSRTGDLAEAAANLFAMLRRLDRPEFTGIAVLPIPEQGLGRSWRGGDDQAWYSALRRWRLKPRSRARSTTWICCPLPRSTSTRRSPRSSARSERKAGSKIRTSRNLIWRKRAVSTAAGRGLSCCRLRPRRWRPSCASAPGRACRSCRRAAIPGWSAARCRPRTATTSCWRLLA